MKFKISLSPLKKVLPYLSIILFLIVVIYTSYLYYQNSKLVGERDQSIATIQKISSELNTLKTQDPYKTNSELKKEIEDIQKTFSLAVSTYESLLDLETPPKNIKGLDELFANILVLLGKRDYTEAVKKLSENRNSSHNSSKYSCKQHHPRIRVLKTKSNNRSGRFPS